MFPDAFVFHVSSCSFNDRTYHWDMAFSQLTIGRMAAVVTVLIWTSFIIVARASASHVLLPLDIACARILGASSVLLPWAWWLMREARQRGEKVGSLWGLSPLPLHITVQAAWSEIVFQAAFQGVGSVVISGITFTQMIRTFGPVKSTMITALVPGLSALGAVVFLDEPLSWNLWVGLALVTCGILFGVRQAMVKPPFYKP